MDEKIERLIEWAGGKTMPPLTLDINPTDNCNLRCIHCWQRAFKKIDSDHELSDEKLRYDRSNQKLGKYCSICSDIEYNSIIRRILNERVS